MYSDIGAIIRDVRKSKNYSQSIVAKGIMHQTNYSKFELGEIEISYNKFKELLINLEIDIVEFEYLYSLKHRSLREEILYNFYQIKFIDEDLLNQIINDSIKYLKKNSDRYINDILNVSRALMAIKDDNFELASTHGDKIWERLKNSDSWYLWDIRLINNILFLFPIETAKYIAEFALKQGEKYKRHPEHENIFLPFKYNLVHLLLREKRIEEAQKLNDEILKVFRERKFYTQIALCTLRKSMIELHLNNENYSRELLSSAHLIAHALNDTNLSEKLNQEESYIHEILNSDT
ncbi:helix-turn-helix domain-containing protein [Exiguobacterium sp. s189]|uniref:helix-turn-helix domain-containing protein n=1 Tax=Exiguobacterium sp. s189 TaxID=2751263 RepID=UPI001BEB2F8D|nr:helix-turn-helix transcriptional regulator [Exiguobacterium sp. s189]